MAALKTRALDVYDGEHIAELLEIDPSEELRVYASRWLEQFPDDQDAPDLLAALMDTVPHCDVERLVEYYLEEAVCDDLRRLVSTIIKKDDQSLKAYGLIAMRLEKEPKSYTWASGLALYPEQTAAADKLALRWLDINAQNPRTQILALCTFTQSPAVIKKLLNWIQRNPTADHMQSAMALEHLMRTAAKYHPSSVHDLIILAREWIVQHKDSQDAGHVHSCLIYASNQSNDREAAKEWYLKHRSAKTAWYVLAALLARSGDLVDEFAVKETKANLERQTPEERIPALVGSFFRAVKDEDSFRFARELCLAQPSPWILEDLLAYAPDSELLEKAQGLLLKWNGHEAGGKLLLALLNAEPQNTKTRELVEAWLLCNRDHEDAGKIADLLILHS